MTLQLWIGCAAFGALGAIARAVTAGLMTRRFGVAFPWGTMAVNLTGAFALGVLHGVEASHTMTMLVGAGLLGSLTTFSTWMLETLRLAQHRLIRAAANLGGSLALGLGVVALGSAVGSVV